MLDLRSLFVAVFLVYLCLANPYQKENCDPEITRREGTVIGMAGFALAARPFVDCSPVPEDLKCYIEADRRPGCSGSVDDSGALIMNCGEDVWIVRHGSPCALKPEADPDSYYYPAIAAVGCGDEGRGAGTRYKAKDGQTIGNRLHLFKKRCGDPKARCYVEVEEPKGCIVDIDWSNGDAVATCSEVRSWFVRDGRPCEEHLVLERLDAQKRPITTTTTTTTTTSAAFKSAVSSASFLCLFAAFFGLIL